MVVSVGQLGLLTRPKIATKAGGVSHFSQIETIDRGIELGPCLPNLDSKEPFLPETGWKPLSAGTRL